MSSRALLATLGDSEMVPASFVREVAREIVTEVVTEAVDRELTIRMWRRRGTERYLADLPLGDTPDTFDRGGNWDTQNQTGGHGRIRLVREE